MCWNFGRARRRRREQVEPKPTVAEMEAALEEPIEQTVLRGEAVVLKPYAERLFQWTASLMPKSIPTYSGAMGYYTGASAACASVPAMTSMLILPPGARLERVSV
jgi:hypothetical protein